MNAVAEPTSAELAGWNEQVRNVAPLEITRWAVAQARGRAIVSTNFRPYEAVVLHLAATAAPAIPVLWADHGYNRPATYRHAEGLRQLLRLNLKSYVPRITAAHRDAISGPIPTTGDERSLREFSDVMKLEPFRRGFRELAPAVWLTGLRHVQNAGRAALEVVSWDENFGALKVCPVLQWDDAQMDSYLRRHDLPNEWDYFDPAKADEKRECGLHVSGAVR